MPCLDQTILLSQLVVKMDSTIASDGLNGVQEYAIHQTQNISRLTRILHDCSMYGALRHRHRTIESQHSKAGNRSFSDGLTSRAIMAKPKSYRTIPINCTSSPHPVSSPLHRSSDRIRIKSTLSSSSPSPPPQCRHTLSQRTPRLRSQQHLPPSLPILRK